MIFVANLKRKQPESMQVKVLHGRCSITAVKSEKSIAQKQGHDYGFFGSDF